MQISDLLAQAGGLQTMARELGISEAQVSTAAGALLPTILGGMQKQVTASAGGLGGLLSKLGGGGLLDQVLSPQPTDVAQGNDVLGQIFGSKDVSRAVAGNAATETGLDPALLKKMLPMLAMVVTGYFAKQGGTAAAAAPEASGGGLGSMLGSLLGGRSTGGGATSGLGKLAALLDADGNGNPLDDILRMINK